MILTEENYYSVEADNEYMSCSQYQGFMECEAKQLAKLQKRWVEEPTDAFIVGNFFHSHFESREAHQTFCIEHMDRIYTKASIKKYENAKAVMEKELAVDGTSKIIPEEHLEFLSPIKQAVKMIDVVERDPLMRQFIDLPGEHERIVSGTLFGVKWRGKLDKYVRDLRFIIDYKTVANIWETTYNPVTKTRETFVEKYGYLMRAAVYSIIEMQEYYNIGFEEAYKKLQADECDAAEFILLCVSKQEYLDKEAIRLNHVKEYIRELEQVKNNLGRIQMVKAGRAAPKRCGQCDYCRSTKQLKEIIPYYELIPGLRAPREEELIQDVT